MKHIDTHFFAVHGSVPSIASMTRLGTAGVRIPQVSLIVFFFFLGGGGVVAKPGHLNSSRSS